MSFAFIPFCAGRIALIADALGRAVGVAAGRRLMSGAMSLLVFARIMRARTLLLALLERVRVGGIRVSVPRAAPRAADPGVLMASRVDPLPRGFGWLCAMVPSDAATYAGQLQIVLAEPGMAELLANCPQALRILRPLCRMLGIARADYVPAAVLPVAVPRVARVRRVVPAFTVAKPHLDFTRVPDRFRLKIR
jgi:hypothetical protein